MAKKIGQIYIKPGAEPIETEWTNNLLVGPAECLSICGLPGTQFKIAQGQQKDYIFILGNTGLFSINLEDQYINNLQIAKSSYNTIVSSEKHYIIIDYVYLEGGE